MPDMWIRGRAVVTYIYPLIRHNPGGDLTDDEQDDFVTYVEKMKGELLAELEKDIAGTRRRLLDQFSEELDNLKLFSDVVDKRALDMAMNEDMAFMVHEWVEHYDQHRPQIQVRAGHCDEYQSPVNFRMVKGGKYRVVVVVEKIGEGEPRKPLEFVGGH